MTVTATDLGTYLGRDIAADDPRATLILNLAITECESVVKPLPDGADAVVLDVAARAYSNPTNAQQQGAGPFQASFGSVAGGLWLTRANKATLRRLNGGGGAFTIDTMPADAGTDLPWWETNAWGWGLGWGTDWDQTP